MAQIRESLGSSECVALINSLIKGKEAQRDLVEFKKKNLHGGDGTVGLGYWKGFKKEEIPISFSAKVYYLAKISDIKNKWLNNRRYFYFSYENYDLEYTLHDKSLHDGDTCLNYDKLTSSYGECIEDKWNEISLGSYGCLPPWFHHKEISLT